MQPTLFDIKPLRALTWKEPFGSLMAHEKIETRKWKTDFRGDVLICCGLTPYREKELIELCGEYQLSRINKIIKPSEYHKGMAIGVATLTDCRVMRKDDEDRTFVKYTGQLWAHIYEDFRPIAPIPYKGQQGWKKLHDSFWGELKFV